MCLVNSRLVSPTHPYMQLDQASADLQNQLERNFWFISGFVKVTSSGFQRPVDVFWGLWRPSPVGGGELWWTPVQLDCGMGGLITPDLRSSSVPFLITCHLCMSKVPLSLVGWFLMVLAFAYFIAACACFNAIGKWLIIDFSFYFYCASALSILQRSN